MLLFSYGDIKGLNFPGYPPIIPKNCGIGKLGIERGGNILLLHECAGAVSYLWIGQEHFESSF